MPIRFSYWALLAVLGLLVLGGCEPYMSMTDPVSTQTRRAAALLPSGPRFVGMLDAEAAVEQIDALRNTNLADTLRQADSARLRTFFEATGLDPTTDLSAIYGAVGKEGEENALSAVVFADLTPTQMDRYLSVAPEAGTRATYRGVPLYRLSLGASLSAENDDPDAAPDTLSLAFVDNGTIAVALGEEPVRAAVDRHRGGQAALQDDEAYMSLIERVGRDRTAWIVGRNVIQSALEDSVETPRATMGGDRPAAQAGVQRALATWANRVLGLSGVSSGMSSLREQADGRIGRLAQKVRDQAIAVTLTDEALEGEVYLTMNDDASAGNVAEMAEGVLAVLRFSQDNLTDRQQDLLDDASVERDGPLVRVQFSIARDLVRPESMKTAARGAARGADASIRPAHSTTRRLSGILGPLPLL